VVLASSAAAASSSSNLLLQQSLVPYLLVEFEVWLKALFNSSVSYSHKMPTSWLLLYFLFPLLFVMAYVLHCIFASHSAFLLFSCLCLINSHHTYRGCFFFYRKRAMTFLSLITTASLFSDFFQRHDTTFLLVRSFLAFFRHTSFPRLERKTCHRTMTFY
jgi:hypothetical protein